MITMKPYGKPCKIQNSCPCCRHDSDINDKPGPRSRGDKRSVRRDKRVARSTWRRLHQKEMDDERSMP